MNTRIYRFKSSTVIRVLRFMGPNYRILEHMTSENCIAFRQYLNTNQYNPNNLYNLRLAPYLEHHLSTQLCIYTTGEGSKHIDIW